MKLIIDAHLPKLIATYFADCDVIHTSQLEDGNLTSDDLINKISIDEQRILITKDSDFYYSYIGKRKPYKLVLVKLGNMRLRQMLFYFERNASKIIELLHENSFIILEQERIRVLD